MGKSAAIERIKDSLLEFEADHPGCRLDGPKDDGLRSYANLQNWLCFGLWSKDEAVAEYIYKEYSGPDCLLRRIGDDPLLLCAATVYGLKEGIPEAVPSREVRERTLTSVKRGIPLFDRLAELSGKSEPDRHMECQKIYYRKLCRDVLTMPEREPVADEVLIQTLRDKTDAFFRDHLAELKKDTIDFPKQVTRDYMALAYPVLCAVREGNLAVADFVTFGMAPNRDPFMAVGDFWIKSAAAAVVGVAKTDNDRYDWHTTMLGLIDFFVAYGKEEAIHWDPGCTWVVPSQWEGIDRNFILSREWWYTTYYNVTYRMDYDLRFDYLDQIWFGGRFGERVGSISDLWIKDGFPGNEDLASRYFLPEQEEEAD